jgi:hypothetical protein
MVMADIALRLKHSATHRPKNRRPGDQQITGLTIDSSGMRIGKPFWNVIGILAGNPQQATTGELERLAEMFRQF